MTQITQNNCTVRSLRPLEVICNPTNATSPETQDGSIQLYINGGTSPYTVSWESGAQGTFINNLQAGDYTATVTDYYGDYTETITCTVENGTFYIDKFSGCPDTLTTEIYSETINGLIQDKVYKFLEIDGCYKYDQRLLFSGQSYSALTITNVYDECIDCEPPAPTPTLQPTLCLSDNTNQYEFLPLGTDSNGYFIWENTGNTLTLSYNITLNRWEITPWSNIGVGNMVRAVNQEIPVGNFTNLGNPQSLIWTMTQGICEGIPLSLTTQTSPEVCLGSDNGSVVLTSSGGYPPYQYRIQNVSPYPSYNILGVFNNLPSGNYLGESIDSSGNTTSTVFTINAGEVPIDHTVSLTSNIISQANGTRTWNYAIQINPPLPTGVSVSFDINLNHLRKYRDVGTYNFSYTHTITKNGTINIPYNTSTTGTTNNNTNCETKPVIEYTTTFNDVASSVTYSSTDTSITGLITQTVTINGQNADCGVNCRMLGTYNTTLQVSNVSISGSNCSNAVNANSLVRQNITIFDCQAQP